MRGTARAGYWSTKTLIFLLKKKEFQAKHMRTQKCVRPINPIKKRKIYISNDTAKHETFLPGK